MFEHMLKGAGLLPLSFRFFKERYFLLSLLAALPAIPLLLFIFAKTGQPTPPTVKLFLSIVIVTPVMEELIFRGFIQGWMLESGKLRKSLIGPVTAANMAVSVIFAATHLYTHTPLWAMLVFFPSLLLGLARERAGNVYPSIILHSFYNMVYLLAAHLALFSG